mgnify:CR=1 FL=1
MSVLLLELTLELTVEIVLELTDESTLEERDDWLAAEDKEDTWLVLEAISGSPVQPIRKEHPHRIRALSRTVFVGGIAADGVGSLMLYGCLGVLICELFVINI